LAEGVVLSVAVLQAERWISRWAEFCARRSLRPLVKTRAFGMTPSKERKTLRLKHYPNARAAKKEHGTG